MNRMLVVLVAVLTAALHPGVRAAPDAKPQAATEFRPYRRPVTIWVPPYAVEKDAGGLASRQSDPRRGEVTRLATLP